MGRPGHIIFDGKIYNGYDATSVGSKGAIRNDIAEARERIVGRGVLLDVPRARACRWLEPGDPIRADDLEACAARAGREVGRGDIVLIRTGQMAQCRDAGDVGRLRRRSRARPRPRHARPWIVEREIAGRRHRHVGHGGAAERDAGRLPAAAHHPDRAHGPA